MMLTSRILLVARDYLVLPLTQPNVLHDPMELAQCSGSVIAIGAKTLSDNSPIGDGPGPFETLNGKSSETFPRCVSDG